MGKIETLSDYIGRCDDNMIDDEEKYNEWMNKLTDVYQDEAQKITDAYQDSVLG